MNFVKRKSWRIVIAAVYFLGVSLAKAQQPNPVEIELLRSAQMWSNKNRLDIARDQLDKLLSINPGSPEGLMFSAEMALKEKKVEDAQKILAVLQAKHPKHPATQSLEMLIRVNTHDSEKLSQMRLFARAGRKDEASRLAQELFPDGPPSVGGFAQEYYQIIGVNQKNAQKANQQLTRLYSATGDPNYRLRQIEIQLAQAKSDRKVLHDLEALSTLPGIDQTKLKELWSRAIGQLGRGGQQVTATRLFLKKFPGDPAMAERLAEAQKAVERSERKSKDPLTMARATVNKALDGNELELAEKNLEFVLQLYPNDVESLGNLGLVRLRQGRHAEAEALFSKANALSPQDKWTKLAVTAKFWGLLRLAELAVAEKTWATATGYATQAVDMAPDNVEGLLTLAEIKALSGDVESAQEMYHKVIRLDASNSSALKGLAVLMNRQGQTDRALDLLEKASANTPELAKALLGTRANILQNQAESLMESNRYGPAIRAFESALILLPNDPWLRYKTAKLYQRLDQPREALAVMDDGIAALPKDPEMRYARALVRSSLDDDAGAGEDIEQISLAQRTPNMLALQRSANVGLKVKAAIAATNAIDQATSLVLAESLAGNDPDLLLSVANAWFAMGQPMKGVAVFDALQTRQPKLEPDAQLQHAILLNRSKQDARLEQKLPGLLGYLQWNEKQERRLLDLYADFQGRQIQAQQQAGNNQEAWRLAHVSLPSAHPANSAWRDRARGQLLMAAEDFAQAVEVLRGSLVHFPDDLQLHSDLGYALSKSGAYVQAADQAQWLSKHITKEDVNERLALVRLWQRAKVPDQARQELDRLVAQFPGSLDVLLAAARFEQGQGENVRALALFRMARDLGTERLSLKISENLDHLYGGDKGGAAVAPIQIDPAVQAEIQRGIDLIEAKQNTWIEVGQKRLQKSATNGISSLDGWERTALISWADKRDGRFFFQMDQVELSAGNFSAENINRQDFGQIPALTISAYPADVLSQSARGFNLGAGYERDGLRFDFGLIGVGLPVTNIVGGVSRSFDIGPYSVSMDVTRRPLTGSLLSYAGVADPVTQQIWGGVVATGVGGRIATDFGRYGVSASANYSTLTGKNVETNSRTRLRFAVDRDILDVPNQRVNLGLTLSAWHYGKDLSEFTWGHGGYYSPQRYVALSIPIEWTGHQGALSWQLRGAPSFSRSSSEPSNYFPTDAGLQNQANPIFAGGVSTGPGFSLKGALEYKVALKTIIGAQLEIERSDYYAPTNFLLYARHYWGDASIPVSKKPSPVSTYSSF